MIGKTVGKSLFTLEGKCIILAGTIVTQATIDLARKHNQLSNLIFDLKVL